MQLLINIFFRPKIAIQTILKDHNEHIALLIAGLSGALGIFKPGFGYNSDMIMPNNFLSTLSYVLVAGIIEGIITLYVATLCYYLIGKILKGAATFSEIKTALAWSLLPSVLMGLILLAPNIGIRTYATGPKYGELDWLKYDVIPYLRRAAQIISIIILVGMLIEIQKFPLWKAVVNFAPGYILQFVLVLFLSMVIPLLLILVTGASIMVG